MSIFLEIILAVIAFVLVCGFVWIADEDRGATVNQWVGRVCISNRVGGDRHSWTVEEHLSFDSSAGKILIKPGMQTDGASIPRLFWRFIGGPFSGRYIAAALIHDGLYASKSLPRKRCDEIFREAMVCSGVANWKANLMYSAVRIGGKFPWKGYTTEQVKKAQNHIEVA